MFIVSSGNTSSAVFLAMANVPACPSAWFTAFQPPNSLISATLPTATPLESPIAFIFWIFELFSTVSWRPCNLSDKSFTLAFALGAAYTWFAAGSVSVVVSPVRNGLFLSRACLLRGSRCPEFAIELVPVAFSVLLAFLPTVAFPSVVSSLGLSTCTLGLLRKPLFTVIKSRL